MYQLIDTLLDRSSTFFSSLNLEVQGHFFNMTTVIAVLMLLGLTFLAGRAPGLWAKGIAGILFLTLVGFWFVAWQVSLSHPRKMTYETYKMLDQGDGLPLVNTPVPRMRGTDEYFEVLVEVPSEYGEKRSEFFWEAKTKQLQDSYSVAMEGIRQHSQRGTLKLRWEKSLNPNDQMRFYYAPPQVPPAKFGPPPAATAPSSATEKQPGDTSP